MIDLLNVYFFIQGLLKLSKIILNDAKQIQYYLPSTKLPLKKSFKVFNERYKRYMFLRPSIQSLNFSLVSLFTCVHGEQINTLGRGTSVEARTHPSLDLSVTHKATKGSAQVLQGMLRLLIYSIRKPKKSKHYYET